MSYLFTHYERRYGSLPHSSDGPPNEFKSSFVDRIELQDRIHWLREQLRRHGMTLQLVRRQTQHQLGFFFFLLAIWTAFWTPNISEQQRPAFCDLGSRVFKTKGCKRLSDAWLLRNETRDLALLLGKVFKSLHRSSPTWLWKRQSDQVAQHC